MPKETFPDKKEGDVLGASHVNKLNRVGRAFNSMTGGSYGYSKDGQPTNIAPFIQYPVEIIKLSCDGDSSLVEVHPLYFDFDGDGPKWKKNGNAGPYCLDPTVYDDTSVTPPVSALDLAKGDRITAWWDPQRNMFLPMPPGVTCTTIHFKIISADCILKTALVQIEFRSAGCSKAPEETALGRVTVHDSMECHLDEPNADLVDRKGAATYMTRDSDNKKQWEIDDICCDPNICLP